MKREVLVEKGCPNLVCNCTGECKKLVWMELETWLRKTGVRSRDISENKDDTEFAEIGIINLPHR